MVIADPRFTQQREVKLIKIPRDSKVKKYPFCEVFEKKVAFSLQKTIKLYTTTHSRKIFFYLITGFLDQFCLQNIQSAINSKK